MEVRMCGGGFLGLERMKDDNSQQRYEEARRAEEARHNAEMEKIRLDGERKLKEVNDRLLADKKSAADMEIDASVRGKSLLGSAPTDDEEDDDLSGGAIRKRKKTLLGG
jgi:hypothetical protein